ncbi:unnamed protein product [marine sediment metagenome]|uniref:Ribbon-helix-helix protein CopG domain-containing protein n=1 Tax=marine sediment metagenome TaxID=412755 RepID=X1LSY7_9ZZZZ
MTTILQGGRRALMQLHLSEGEKRLLHVYARKDGISPSMWIRRAIYNELKRRGMRLGAVHGL